MRGSREGGGAGGPDPSPEKSQKIGFPSNNGPDPLKSTQLPSKRSILCNHRHASEWRFADGPMMTHL